MIKRFTFGPPPPAGPPVLRAVTCRAIPELSDPGCPHDQITIEWFADRSPDPGAGPIVVAGEQIVRGARWLAGRWRDGGDTVKHIALATRAAGLTQAEFSRRWRSHAGTVGTTPIPGAARGLAYVQNHPVPGDWPYDAINEVYFDDVDGLTARVEWFRANVPDPADGVLFGRSWLIAVREVIA